MTAEQYGPIAILAVWEDGNAESFYLVTNMSDLDAALAHYRKRPHIETFSLTSRAVAFICIKVILPTRRVSVDCCLPRAWLTFG